MEGLCVLRMWYDVMQKGATHLENWLVICNSSNAAYLTVLVCVFVCVCVCVCVCVYVYVCM